jgi:hypothetical protein
MTLRLFVGGAAERRSSVAGGPDEAVTLPRLNGRSCEDGLDQAGRIS